jgi:MinD-like ATPase involved in chromosome partitioning or flagellar assembly
MQEVHFFLVDHGGALVRGYVMSADDATSERADVLIIDDTSSFLTERLVVDLHRAGTRVVGVFDPIDGTTGRERLEHLGVDECVRSDSSGDSFLEVVKRLADRDESGDTPSGADPAAGDDAHGRLIAVGAAGGGTGATEVAIALATRLRSRAQSVALVDADDVTPSIAQRLGLPLHPNLQSAVEAMVHGSDPLEHCVIDHSSGIGVVGGLSRPADRRRLRAPDVMGVLRSMTGRFSVVVANVSAQIGDEESRYTGATLSRRVIDAARTVVLVGVASPVGMSRIAEWLGAAQLEEPRANLHVVLNRFPGGGYRSAEIVDELLRIARPRSATVIPFDRRVQRAEWRGVSVRRGPFHRAARRVALHISESETIA